MAACQSGGHECSVFWIFLRLFPMIFIKYVHSVHLERYPEREPFVAVIQVGAEKLSDFVVPIPQRVVVNRKVISRLFELPIALDDRFQRDEQVAVVLFVVLNQRLKLLFTEVFRVRRVADRRDEGENAQFVPVNDVVAALEAANNF